MSVKDEILAVCSELDKAGTALTYDTIRAARGRGSRRDIAAGLREWHRLRAQEIAAASLKMPDRLQDMGGELVRTLWSAMEEEFAKLRREVAAETNLIEHHAEEEIEHLHKIIGEQYGELEDLRDAIKGLKAELGILE